MWLCVGEICLFPAFANEAVNNLDDDFISVELDATAGCFGVVDDILG